MTARGATEGSGPAKPISSHDVAWEDWSEAPRFGVRFRHLTGAAIGDDYHVGVAIEELVPGKQSSQAHYHIHEEEHVFLLEGALTARIGSRTFEMKAGDYVVFPAGQKAGISPTRRSARSIASACSSSRPHPAGAWRRGTITCSKRNTR